MKFATVLSILCLALGTLCLGYIPKQSDFSMILLSSVAAFSAYAMLVFNQVSSLKLIFVTGIIIRFFLLFTFPQLSDDIYRFVWDGFLTANGFNPYGYLPTEIVDQEIFLYNKELFQYMNSPEYYTIYPPVSQLIFYLSTWAGDHLFWNSLIIRTIFFGAECLTFLGLIRILEGLKKPKVLAGIYFLNPLIMIEGMGNLHFEIIMVCFLVWAVYYLFILERTKVGAILFALSIGVKLLPLMFLPFFLFAWKGRKRSHFFIVGTIGLIMVFLPIIFGLDFANFGTSIDLYFRKFEFNASVYYVLRYFGKLLSGYNLIYYLGPILGVVSLLLILKRAASSQPYDLASFFRFSLFSFIVYLFFATTIHPWYLILPLMFSVFVRWRFVVIWSFLVILTYVNYSYSPYTENLWVVGFEYIFLISFIYFEWKNIHGTSIKLLEYEKS